MSDNLRRYRAIRQALTQCYPGEPSGQMARHLNTLAALISGMVGSKSSQLPSIATKIPDAAKPESRAKRFGSDVHVMLVLHRRSRQVIVANEHLDGPDVVGEFLRE
jgi:hypothetical protein